MKRAATAGAVVGLAAGVACGQPSMFGTAEFWWEGSLDGGATWARDVMEVSDPGASLLVRARAEWEPRWPERYHFFGAVSFDVAVTDAGDGDELTQFIKAPLLGHPVQTLVATRFGNLIKIDDVRDTLPPGEGSRHIIILQLAEEPWNKHFSRDNPLELFRFTMALDGTLGERTVTQVFRHWEVPDHERRFLITYLHPAGGNNYPDSAAHSLRINVVPAPGAAGLAVAGAVLALRRRR